MTKAPRTRKPIGAAERARRLQAWSLCDEARRGPADLDSPTEEFVLALLRRRALDAWGVGADERDGLRTVP